MRIAMILPGGVDPGGRERVIPVLLALIERLAAHHTVLVVALSPPVGPWIYRLRGARVAHLVPPAGHSHAAGLLWRVAMLTQIVRAGKYDMLHAFWLGTTSTVALLAGRALGLPVVVSLGGGEMVRLPEIGYGGSINGRMRLHTRFALRSAQAVTAGSHYALRSVLQIRQDARYQPLGVDTRPFEGTALRPAGPPWRLLHVASINRVKDQPTLLEALQVVTGRLPAVRLDWVGEDTLGGRLQQQIDRLGLAEQVTLHGFQPNDRLPGFYQAAHLLVQSSLHESQGVAVCEAAAAGIPTVGTAVGLVAELAPTAAVAVPPGDAQAVGAAISRLLVDDTRRERLGMAAQEWARAHDADWTAQRFEALYRAIMR
jgi:glycosyltransferase involved in cell wall biosynthesis